jgi:hypothetical protein
MRKIWVNEKLDPLGLMYACIACVDENQAKECNQSFNETLSAPQKAAGWQIRMRSVDSWDDVPVNSLKLD